MVRDEKGRVNPLDVARASRPRYLGSLFRFVAACLSTSAALTIERRIWWVVPHRRKMGKVLNFSP